MNQNKNNYDPDKYSGTADDTGLCHILYGYVIPAVIAALGALSLFTGKFIIISRAGILTVEGSNAARLGTALITGALSLHVHHIWTMSEKLWKCAPIMKIFLLGITIFLLLRTVIPYLAFS